MISSGRYWRAALAALLTVLLFQLTAAVLTPLEESSLREVLAAFPDLERVSPFDSYPVNSWDTSGFSWNPDFSLNWPTGYYGIRSGDGIENIEFTDAWGKIQEADLSGIGNFPFDNSVTIAAASTESTNQFWQALMRSNRSFTHLSQYSATMGDDWSTTEEKSSLQYIVGSLPGTFNLSGFPLLETFHSSGPKPYYDWTSPKEDCSPGFVDYVNGFSEVNRTLRYLETFCTSVTPRIWADVTEELGVLSYWGCGTCSWSLNTPPAENMINLTMLPSFASIEIRSPQGAGTSAKFFFEGPGLQEIRLYDFPAGSSIEVGNTPMLRQLKLLNVPNLPDGLLEVNSLQEIDINITSSSWINTIPSIIANQSRLAILKLEGPFDTQSLQNAICNSTYFSTLHITISSASPASIVWPDCTRFKSLNVLSVKAHRQFNMTDFFSKLPFDFLSEMTLTNMFDISTNSTMDFTTFYGRESLRSLSIVNNDLTGIIPDDFFTSGVTLENIDFSGNSLHGNVPYNGLSRLLKMVLKRNAFTAWPDLQGQSGLLVVDLSFNQLATIPNDTLLLNLQSLSISNNPMLSGPLPGFWADSINLLQFYASDCSFSGPMQSPVENSRLHTLNLANNYLCGSLPEVPINNLDLSGNRFTGSIPSSWVNPNYTIISLNLKGNYFDGTVPRDLFTSRTLIRASLIDLSNSNWHGPMFNLSKLGLPLKLNLEGSNFDLCSEDPSIPSINSLGRYTPTCNFPAFAHCGCASFYGSCQGLSSCSGSPAAFTPRNDPNGPTCVAFPPGPVTQVPSCNPPAGFRCSSKVGEIIIDGDLSTPSYEVPDGFDSVIVNGDVIVDTVVFRGTTSSLTATGCISTGKVVVEVSEFKESKSKVIMSQSGSNCTQSLANLLVSVKAPSSCKKIVPDTSGSTRSTLNLAFTIDNKSCNTKWIILGSVLGAALIIGVVSLALLVKFNSKVRLFFLPYTGANS